MEACKQLDSQDEIKSSCLFYAIFFRAIVNRCCKRVLLFSMIFTNKFDGSGLEGLSTILFDDI